jgi:hypothetical protein
MATNHWNTGSGNWSVASNWSGNSPPPSTTGANAIIDQHAGTYTVTLDTSETIGSLTLNWATATLAIGSRTLTITSTGGQAGTATLTAGHVTIAGGTITTTGGISVASGTYIIGFGTLSGTGSLSGTGVVRASGTLTISANIASGVTGLQIGSGTNTLALGGSLAGSDTITLQSASDTLSLTSSTSVGSFASAGNTNTLAGFAAGDKIHIGSGATVTNVVLSHPTGTTTDLTVSLSGGGTGTAVFHLNSAETGLFANWTGTDISLGAAPCYLAGTRIQTARGEVAVEDLKVGDLLVTDTGEMQPLLWIGTRDHVTQLIVPDQRATLLPIRFAR